jgi:hypothetical protein
MSIRPVRPLPPLRWFADDEPAYPRCCSACAAEIAEGDGPPLLLFRADGSALLCFCRACQETYWGIQSFDHGKENT